MPTRRPPRHPQRFLALLDVLKGGAPGHLENHPVRHYRQGPGVGYLKRRRTMQHHPEPTALSPVALDLIKQLTTLLLHSIR